MGFSFTKKKVKKKNIDSQVEAINHYLGAGSNVVIMTTPNAEPESYKPKCR